MPPAGKPKLLDQRVKAAHAPRVIPQLMDFVFVLRPLRGHRFNLLLVESAKAAAAALEGKFIRDVILLSLASRLFSCPRE